MYYLCVVSADGKSFSVGQRPQLPIFYPQEYLDEAERRGLCDKDATMRHGKRWVVEDMEGVPLHQAMEDGADKARAGDRGRILSSRCPWRASRWHCNLVLHDPGAGSFGIFSAFFRLPY